MMVFVSFKVQTNLINSFFIFAGIFFIKIVIKKLFYYFLELKRYIYGENIYFC